jgi:3-oxoacyl-[acyl-carrier protein] reductase
VAIVTGANHGIGAATAVALARDGCDVLVTYWRFEPYDDDRGRPEQYSRDRLGDAAGVLSSIGERGLPVEADLSDASVIPSLFDAAEKAFGPVDILVNNASGWRKDTFGADIDDRFGRALHPVTAESFDAQFAVDARGGALLIAELARRLADRGASWGRIVSLTSGGPQGFPGEVSYGAAKAALENYTMSAAHELGPLGVTANVVHPPITDTGWITPEVEAFAATYGPLRHIGQPADVAGVIRWLCTDEAALVTANVIRLY